MLEKDEVKRIFTQGPPYSKPLEDMFGNAYMDHPDLTSSDVPQGLKEITPDGLQVFNVSELIGRAIEEARPISCEENQQLVKRAIEGYIADTESISSKECWMMTAHMSMSNCYNEECLWLYDIAVLDNRLTPEEMKELYERRKKAREG